MLDKIQIWVRNPVQGREARIKERKWSVFTDMKLRKGDGAAICNWRRLHSRGSKEAETWRLHRISAGQRNRKKGQSGLSRKVLGTPAEMARWVEMCSIPGEYSERWAWKCPLQSDSHGAGRAKEGRAGCLGHWLPSLATHQKSPKMFKMQILESH